MSLAGVGVPRVDRRAVSCQGSNPLGPALRLSKLIPLSSMYFGRYMREVILMLFEESEVLLGTGLSGSGPVRRDRFSPFEMNPHQVVMSVDPSVGSFHAGLIALRESERGVGSFIVDTRGRYSGLAVSLGGRVLELGRGGARLNPFLLRHTGDGYDAATRVAGLVSLVSTMAGDAGGLYLRSLVDRCLTGFYALELRSSDGSGLLGLEGFPGFLGYLDSPDVIGGSELSGLLGKLVQESCVWLLGGGGWDVLGDGLPIVSFDLGGVPDGVKPFASAVCIETLWGLVVSRPGPRLLLVDECGEVLSSPGGASVLDGVVKRSRKLGLGVVSVTSDAGRFLADGQHPGGRSILRNSAFRMAFGQDPGMLDPVSEALGLSPESRQFLENAAPGEGVLSEVSGDLPVSGLDCSAGERDVLSGAGLC